MRARGKVFQRLYGLSAEDVSSMFEDQGGRCAGCSKEIVLGGRLPESACVDHDHSTGQVRGLLCRECNMALGLLHDNAEVVDKLSGYRRRYAE